MEQDTNKIKNRVTKIFFFFANKLFFFHKRTEREELGESSREWMVEVCKRYEGKNNFNWDYIYHLEIDKTKVLVVKNIIDATLEIFRTKVFLKNDIITASNSNNSKDDNDNNKFASLFHLNDLNDISQKINKIKL